MVPRGQFSDIAVNLLRSHNNKNSNQLPTSRFLRSLEDSCLGSQITLNATEPCARAIWLVSEVLLLSALDVDTNFPIGSSKQF